MRASEIDVIKKRLMQSRDAFAAFADKRAGELGAFAAEVVATYRRGGKVLIFGNGGSAAEAQHAAAELVNRMLKNRAPLPAIALVNDAAIVTSVSNDFSFDEIFKKQVEALGRPEDLAWGLSTSGKSKNVNMALEAAKRIGMKTVGMTGRPGSPIDSLCDVMLWVDSPITGVIQEIHLAAIHVICQIVEDELFPEAKNG